MWHVRATVRVYRVGTDAFSPASSCEPRWHAPGERRARRRSAPSQLRWSITARARVPSGHGCRMAAQRSIRGTSGLATDCRKVSTVHATDLRKRAKLGFSPARLRFLSEANANYGFAVRNYPAAQVLGSDWIGAKSTRLASADRSTTNLELHTPQAVTQMDPGNSRGLRRMEQRIFASHVVMSL